MTKFSARRRSKKSPTYQTLELRHLLATITVDTLSDSVTPESDGLVSLREAIEAANRDESFRDAPAGDGDDVIVFAPSIQGGEIKFAGEQMVIRSAIAINGPMRLNAIQQSRHFRIATPQAVSLHQLTLVNGNDAEGGSLQIVGNVDVTITETVFKNNQTFASGGVISQSGGTVVIASSTFERNRSTTDAGNGGAIHSANSQLEIRSSTFLNNSAAQALGGAVHVFNGTASINDSVFSRNSEAPTPNSARAGGFIANSGSSVEISRSQFIAGRSRTAGGAILNLGAMTVSGSLFSDNVSLLGDELSGQEKGGAIYSTGTLSVRNAGSQASTFEGNRSALGGAIYSDGMLTATSETRFTSNEARVGGALRLVNDTFRIVDVFFVSNNASFGGAISVFNSSLRILNPVFRSNGSASAGESEIQTQRGGAIDSVNTSISVSVPSSSKAIVGGFIQNEAKFAGGHISSFGGSLTLTGEFSGKMRLTGSNGDVFATRGGAIFANGTDIVLKETSIGQNRAERAGGSLYLHNSNVEITSSFVSGISDDIGGAMMVTGNSQVLVEASIFRGSQARNGGGSIHVNRGTDVRIQTSDFIGSRLTAEALEIARGGAIQNFGNLTVVESRFSENRASSQAFDRVRALGGAIFNGGEVEISASSFEANTANRGGAIYSTAPTRIIESDFETNRTESISGAPTFGGAIFLSNDSEISDSTFKSNVASNGGAIASFHGHSVGRGLTFGGGTSGEGNTGAVLDLTFEGGFGGAILIGSGASWQLSSSTFENNQTSRLGGAIAVFGRVSDRPSLVVDENTVFRSNGPTRQSSDTDVHGGAIGTYNSVIEVRDSVFEQNTSGGPGGALFFGRNADAKIQFSSLDSNESGRRGGAIFNSGMLFLADSLVARNSALIDGGLAESPFAQTTVERTEFIDNVP